MVKYPEFKQKCGVKRSSNQNALKKKKRRTKGVGSRKGEFWFSRRNSPGIIESRSLEEPSGAPESNLLLKALRDQSPRGYFQLTPCMRIPMGQHRGEALANWERVSHSERRSVQPSLGASTPPLRSSGATGGRRGNSEHKPVTAPLGRGSCGLLPAACCSATEGETAERAWASGKQKHRHRAR